MIGLLGLDLSLGFIIMSFVLWKNLRADYGEDEVLTLTCILGLTALIGGYLLRLHEWGAIFPSLLVLIWWCKKYKWHTGDWLDILVTGGLAISAVAFLVVDRSNLLLSVSLGLSFLITVVCKKYYRGWTWYKSGKPGFVGLVGLMLWSISRIGIAFGGTRAVYLWGLSVDQWIGVWTLTTASIVLYLRSGHKLIWQNKKANPQ